MPEVRFVDVGPDDEKELRRWYEVVRAASAVDRPGDPLPGYGVFAGKLRIPMPRSEHHLLLAEADGAVVGWLGQWLSTQENLDVSRAELEVHPGHRRRGHGRALVDEWARRATALGRSRLVGGAAGDGGAAFATATGFRGVLADTQRRLDVSRLGAPGLTDLQADARAHAAGYSVVQWTGATPERYLPGMATLESRMTTDAPLDDLVWEQEVYDADRLREHERVWIARGSRRYTSAALHDESGEVVGSTSIGVFEGAHEGAYQWQTIVSPEHRGHRLGMLLKVENLAFLCAHEPAVRTVDTWNADSNAHMLRVNLAMGFEVVRQWSEYERVL